MPNRAVTVKLTDKQEKFCVEYLTDLNATQAAVRSGYSPNLESAATEGGRLLGKVEIQERLTQLRAEIIASESVTPQSVIHELKRIGFSDIRRHVVYSADGVTLRSSEQLSNDDAAAVQMVSQTVTKEGGSISFKLHDKIKALELCGKHLGMFDTNVNLNGRLKMVLEGSDGKENDLV
jgi:phage terminase small subunit